jgi:hypothetical protein
VVLSALEPSTPPYAAGQSLSGVSFFGGIRLRRSFGNLRALPEDRRRGRYEADLARRRCDAVDPANRLVARMLEHRWEQALGALDALEREAATTQQTFTQALSREEQVRLRRFAEDLPPLWHASTARVHGKKRLVRCLVRSFPMHTVEQAAERLGISTDGGCAIAYLP